MISKEKVENKEEKVTKKIFNNFLSMNLKSKFTIFYISCFSYLIFLGILAKKWIFYSKILEDQIAMDLRRNIFDSLFRNKLTNFNSSVIV